MTSGPWKRLGSTKLIDVTMLQAIIQRMNQSPQTTDSHDDTVSRIHVWAIASNGDALYR